MSRIGMTQVKQETLLKIMEELGCAIQKRKGWFKCYAPDEKGMPTGNKSIGIPTTRFATCVELVRFEHPLAVRHPKPPAGSVTQMLDFAKPENLIRRDLYKITREGLLGQKPADEKQREQEAREEARVLAAAAALQGTDEPEAKEPEQPQLAAASAGE
jgi:hypothetical protein